MQPHGTQSQVPGDLQITVRESREQIEQALVLPAHLQLHEGTFGDYTACDSSHL